MNAEPLTKAELEALPGDTIVHDLTKPEPHWRLQVGYCLGCRRHVPQPLSPTDRCDDCRDEELEREARRNRGRR